MIFKDHSISTEVMFTDLIPFVLSIAKCLNVQACEKFFIIESRLGFVGLLFWKLPPLFVWRN